LPKEEKRFMLVELDKERELNVPKGWKALAVPIFEIHGNDRYGEEIAGVAGQLSGITMEFSAREE
jgi:hypothetical protein